MILNFYCSPIISRGATIICCRCPEEEIALWPIRAVICVGILKTVIPENRLCAEELKILPRTTGVSDSNHVLS